MAMNERNAWELNVEKDPFIPCPVWDYMHKELLTLKIESDELQSR